MADRGDAFKAEGEKALTRTTMLSVFGIGKEKKYEDAVESFTKAGNAYKLATRWQSAGEVFLKASECHLKLGSESEATTSIVEAANCFKKVNPVEAITAFQRAVTLYNDSGKFNRSAGYVKEIAEIYEADNNMEMAMGSYEQAASLYSSDNKKTYASQMLLKVANIASFTLEQYTKAAHIFEQVGKESMESNLGKYSAKGYLFQALLCHLAAGDNVAVRGKLDEYKNVDYSFGASRECGLVEKILGSIESNSAEDFSAHCADFDRISPLDPWKAHMLVKARRHIATDAEEEVDLA